MLTYVFMPNHVHLLVHPLDENYNISNFCKAIKQSTSLKARSNGWISTRLWEAGGGYDRNVTRARSRKFMMNYIHQNPVIAGLSEESLDHKWSSAKWSLTGIIGAIPCVTVASLEL